MMDDTKMPRFIGKNKSNWTPMKVVSHTKWDGVEKNWFLRK